MSLNAVLVVSTARSASDYTSRITESKWFNRDFHLRWQECQRTRDCSPANATSAGISGDLESLLLRNRPLLLYSLLGEVASGKIHRDNSNFLSPFAPSRAWSLKWHGNSPENAVIWTRRCQLWACTTEPGLWRLLQKSELPFLLTTNKKKKHQCDMFGQKSI